MEKFSYNKLKGHLCKLYDRIINGVPKCLSDENKKENEDSKENQNNVEKSLNEYKFTCASPKGELKDNIFGYLPDENISFKIDFNGDLCTLKNLITAT